LHAVVHAGDGAQGAFGAQTVGDVAARQHGERSQAERLAQEGTPGRQIESARSVLDEKFRVHRGTTSNAGHDRFPQRPRSIARRLRGTRSAIATWTRIKPAIADMARKCTTRAA